MNTELTRLVLYTDGSCLKNGSVNNLCAGVGVFHKPGSPLNLSERWLPSLGKATNQRAEIQAAIRALETTINLNAGYTQLEIRSDSRYVIQGVTEWMPRWKKNHWKTAARTEVINRDLWMRLDELKSSHPLELHWVHVFGHSAISGNEGADKLAVAASKLNSKEAQKSKTKRTSKGKNSILSDMTPTYSVRGPVPKKYKIF